MRPIWQGGISFGLIFIPVNLYSATEEQTYQFHFLDKKDHSRIHYSKYRESDGKEVNQDDIVRGYEYEKDKYVIVSEDELDNAHIKRSKSIEVSEFVKMEEIPSEYFDKPYYLAPSEGAEKIYQLLVAALEKTKKVAVAKFVLRNREHLAIIKAEDGLIILNQLRFENEIRDKKMIPISKQKNIEKNELNTAIEIIDQMTKKFNPSKYKDTYSRDIEKMVKEKLSNKKMTTKSKAPIATNPEDLMKKLKESLEKAKTL